jgi:hypothetical protein
MPKLTIDNLPVDVPTGTTLLAAVVHNVCITGIASNCRNTQKLSRAFMTSGNIPLPEIARWIPWMTISASAGGKLRKKV